MCVPLLNPRNVQKAVKNNIIGDSYYSEEDISVSSFDDDSSRSADEDADRSEDRSKHSSKEKKQPVPSRIVKRMREKRRAARNDNSRKNLFNSNDEQGPLRIYGMEPRKTDPIENYDETGEATAMENKI